MATLPPSPKWTRKGIYKKKKKKKKMTYHKNKREKLSLAVEHGVAKRFHSSFFCFILFKYVGQWS